MAIPAAAKHRNKSQNHQGQGEECEENVRNQHREINWTYDSLCCEGCRFLTHMRMVNDVTRQKKRRRNHRSDHAGHVTAPCTVPDQIPTHRDEDGADKIERRVDRRQIGNTHDLFVRLSEVETSLTILDAGHSRTTEKRRTDGRSTTHFCASHRRNVARLVVFVAIAVSLSGGWYLAKRGFGRQWRYRVVEELHKRGVEASNGRLTLDPFRGLVAKNVRIFDYKNREKTLARISEVSLDINYAALIHHEPFLNALDVRNAQIALPLKDAEGIVNGVQLNDLRAHVYFPPEQIYVSQAEGVFCGVRISATGQLIKRANYQPSSPVSEEEWQKGLAILERIVKELQKFSFPATPPSLQIKFSGDVAELENARVEATLSGDRLQRGNYEMRGLSATAEWSDQHLNITHCEWNDGSGSFAGRADWSRQGNRVNFQMRSSLDLKIFLDAFDLGGPLADITFYSPPVVEVSGSANLGQDLLRPEIIGHAIVASFAYKTVPFSDLAADFSWDGERVLLRDVRLGHQTGRLRADLFDGPSDFRLNIDSTISPDAMRGFVPADLAEFLGEWEWQRPPTIHLAIRGQDHNPENWRGDGTVTLDRTQFRGAGMNGGSTKIHFADGAISCQDFRLLRDEGTGDA